MKLTLALILTFLLTPIVWAEDFLIPLDDRPANLLFVEQISRIGSPQTPLRVPPRHLLGKLYTPGQCESLADWTLQNVESGDTVFLAADMWIYGGLVASRSGVVTETMAEDRLKRLKALSQKGVTVHVLATIPRLSLRTSDRQAPYERKLAQWAAKRNLAAAWDILAGKELVSVPKGVPNEILVEYLQIRVRNMRVLGALVDMASIGEIASLVLGQDDSHKNGLHTFEQKALRRGIAERQAGDRVSLLSGIDELTATMVSGVLAERNQKKPTVRVIYSEPEAAQKVPPLETLPLEEMIQQHLDLAGAKRLDTEGADVDLYVHVPYKSPWKLPPEEKRPSSEAFVKSVLEAMKSGRRVAIADLALVNRMDPFLAESVLETIALPELQGFASWNTPANTVGTVVSQLVCHRIAETSSQWRLNERLESEKTHQAFTFARLIDDYAFQTLVRDKVRPQTKGLSSKADPLLNLYGPVGTEIRLSLIEWANQLFAERYLGRTLCLKPQNKEVRFHESRLRVTLPWPRVFEVEAKLDLRLKPTGSACP